MIILKTVWNYCSIVTVLPDKEIKRDITNIQKKKKKAQKL